MPVPPRRPAQPSAGSAACGNVTDPPACSIAAIAAAEAPDTEIFTALVIEPTPSVQLVAGFSGFRVAHTRSGALAR